MLVEKLKAIKNEAMQISVSGVSAVRMTNVLVGLEEATSEAATLEASVAEAEKKNAKKAAADKQQKEKK